jgi:hypothetical protein
MNTYLDTPTSVCGQQLAGLQRWDGIFTLEEERLAKKNIDAPQDVPLPPNPNRPAN